MDKKKTYEQVLQVGVNERKNVEKIVKDIVKEGVENIFLVGCGGSLAVMFPLKYIVDTKSTLSAYVYTANEFNHTKPMKLTSKSLVLLSSYSGSTKETVEAAKYAKSIGASTIAFASKADCALGENVDYIFANDAPSGVTEAKLIVLYQILLCVLNELGFDVKYEEIQSEIALFPELLPSIKKSTMEEAKKFAEKYGDSDFIMVTASGINWGEAYSYSMCILQEMQWIKSHSVHAGEFFHGSFEIIEDNSSLLILQGEDETRPLTERVIDFAKKYNSNYHVVDTANYPMPGVKDENRGLYGMFILLPVLGNYSKALEQYRNHPLSTRRYMGKVEY